jgi:hypothetical protein
VVGAQEAVPVLSLVQLVVVQLAGQQACDCSNTCALAAQQQNFVDKLLLAARCCCFCAS